MTDPPALSIIIPVAEKEVDLVTLLEDLQHRPEGWEIIIVVQENASDANTLKELYHRGNVRVVSSLPGRGPQLNTGAALSNANHLWFLHADSHVAPAAIDALERILSNQSETLWYFNLKFSPRDSVPFIILNEFGAMLRCHFLKLPFGDQGLCMERVTYQSLGGFDTSPQLGEDLRLILKARKVGLPIRCVGSSLTTSSRKYVTRGWLKTTLAHLALTMKALLRDCSSPAKPDSTS